MNKKRVRAQKLGHAVLKVRSLEASVPFYRDVLGSRSATRSQPRSLLLFDLWFDVPHRPTHDADFLGFGSAEIPHLEEVFRSICRIEVEDGIVFQPDSVKAAEIRKEANYAGVRLTLKGLLDTARCPFRLASASTNSRLDLLWSASEGWRHNG